MSTQPPPAGGPAARAPVSSAWLTGALTTMGLIGGVIAAVFTPAAAFPLAAKAFMLAWLVVSVLVIYRVTPRNFIAGYLGGLLTMLIAWRIAGIYGVAWVTRPLFVAFVAFLAQIVDAWRADRRLGTERLLTGGDWHLTFLRIVIGFDMVPHFTEKLFAGAAPFLADVKGFAALGLPLPAAFVVVAGLCELGIAVGVGMGLFTRLAAFCAAAYFLIATIIGGHFLVGFIWVLPGGGWEYPLVMFVLYLSFTVRGGGAFSLDAVLREGGDLAARLRRLV